MSENMYKVIDQFCHLGDMISARGGAEASSVSQVRKWMEKVQKTSPSTNIQGVLTEDERPTVHAACFRSVMVYGSETWASQGR